MPERTDQAPDQPSPAAITPNQILSQPATVELCQQDYADGTDIRHTMAQQEAGQRR